MTAADEARAEAERRWQHESEFFTRKSSQAIFVQGAEWQASRPIADKQVETEHSTSGMTIQNVLEGFAEAATEFGEDYDEALTRAQAALAAEVERLTAQLLAAQATIAEALELHVRGETYCDPGEGMVTTENDRIPDGCRYCGEPWPCRHVAILSRADTSAHDAAILAARVKELRDAAGHIEPPADVDPDTVTAIYDPYDVADLLRARAASIEQTEATK